MDIDNAGELKSNFLSGIAKSLEVPSAIRTLGIRARTSAPGADAMRTIALGIGRKGNQHCLVVRLQRPVLIDHPYVEGIQKKAKGEVDVRYVGRISKLETPSSLQRRRRPLVIGCSIGHFKITAGTLGCFVRDRSSGATMILSNNHVLANENSEKKGDAIISPVVLTAASGPRISWRNCTNSSACGRLR